MSADKALAEPPVPADADLTHFDDMPLEVRRLRDSGIAGTADAEAFRCGVLGWCTAWHQVPAGSLPKEDADLCRLVGLGRDLKTWKRIKVSAMRGWREFADGRLYHPVLTEKVIDGWNSTRMNRWNRECDRLRKENKARGARKEEPLPYPEKPDAVPYAWPPEVRPTSVGNSDGPPPENALNRMEGNGCLEKAPTALSLETDGQKSSPVAEGALPQGARPAIAIAAKRMP